MNDAVLSVDDFRRLVGSEVRQICSDRGWSFDDAHKRGIAFQIWFGLLLADHENLEWDGEQGVFTNNDLKIDVAIEDLDQKALYLVQAKFVSVGQNPPMQIEEVTDFFNRHSALLAHNWLYEAASDELLEYIGDYAQRLEDGWTVQFYFVSTGRASDQTKSHISELESSFQADNPGVSLHLLDFYGIKEYYSEAQSLEQQIPDRVSIDLPRDKFIYSTRPRPTIVAVVKANSLVNVYRREREGLFAYNIRSFLGRKGINREIVKTATDNPKDFFYYNNGVSAICTKIHLDEETGRFTGEKFQVINGAQTIGSLKTVRTLSGDAEILLRITEGESVSTEKGFNAEVIRFNNTQNIIKSSDFRSNDAIQLWLEHKFQELRPRGSISKRIVYVRKRSSRRVQGADALHFEDLAKIRYTWLVEPTRAVADPKSLWSFQTEGGAYEIAFGVRGTLADFWGDSAFQNALLAIVAYFEIEKRINDLIHRDRQQYSFLRRLRFLALGLFAEYLSVKHLSDDELLRSRVRFDGVFSEFWRDAVRELIGAHVDAQREKMTVYALARNEARWGQIKEKFSLFTSAADPVGLGTSG